jgi:hypothetical protein
MCGAQASFLSGLFGARARYSGVSLGYNLASIRRCLAADHHHPGYFATETRRRAGA